MLALTEIQKHVFDTLTGNQPLMNLVQGVHDDVPDNAAFPYITIGEVVPVPFKTHSRDGESLLETINVWSRYKGFKEVNAISEAIRPLLDGVHFTTASFSGFATRVSGILLRDPDGISRHGSFDYRFFAHSVALFA